MWKYFTQFNTRKYIDVLDDLMHSYNHSVHRSIKMKPVSVTKENEKLAWKNLYGRIENPKSPRLKVGDIVRISKQKMKFEKGYEQNWSRELFSIYEVLEREIPVYKLKDLSNEIIKGSFYEQELQKVNDSGYYLVENVLKKRKVGGKTEYFVKFEGYPKKFNAWVSDVKMV
ncbi:uncharacterized protein LOC118180402 [Stegodyphus dumicola]|uniref:uncharacterized protein LOC118180402 n=1 Tax=Stegodyphus dumicola TaxID=202533 RepID=UPI0015B1658B|nr:uncharacterized protein LOC118180402 [Stegodyphus dumicola]